MQSFAPLDRNAINKAIKNAELDFKDHIHPSDPRWAQVYREGLFDLKRVIEMGVLHCYTEGLHITTTAIIQAHRQKLVDIEYPGYYSPPLKHESLPGEGSGSSAEGEGKCEVEGNTVDNAKRSSEGDTGSNGEDAISKMNAH
ncbi:hypothetical protein MIND_00000500 [Mycena indigotica]|uniref:Uncharacterized protein n=1 Tax=Mycena indigotica TaxID=2126181 RepID=A0A8H6WHA6_9AGAR|nr:uncharacterized protein MIND_00000500 [Mycena indigotica]KAF7314868.1 hypothetical protein MIND_00000500 [Mycena indigotica]